MRLIKTDARIASNCYEEMTAQAISRNPEKPNDVYQIDMKIIEQFGRIFCYGVGRDGCVVAMIIRRSESQFMTQLDHTRFLIVGATGYIIADAGRKRLGLSAP